jgi:hypothetical protein
VDGRTITPRKDTGSQSCDQGAQKVVFACLKAWQVSTSMKIVGITGRDLRRNGGKTAAKVTCGHTCETAVTDFELHDENARAQTTTSHLFRRTPLRS